MHKNLNTKFIEDLKNDKYISKTDCFEDIIRNYILDFENSENIDIEYNKICYTKYIQKFENYLDENGIKLKDLKRIHILTYYLKIINEDNVDIADSMISVASMFMLATILEDAKIINDKTSLSLFNVLYICDDLHDILFEDNYFYCKKNTINEEMVN